MVAPQPGPAGLTAMVAGIALPTQRAGLCSDVTPVTVPTATRPTRFVLRARRSSGVSTARLRMQCTAAQ